MTRADLAQAGGTEPAGAPGRVAERADLAPGRLNHRRDQQLGDAFAPADDEILRPVVDQDHMHFAPVVGVDGAGTFRQVTPARRASPDLGRT